MRKNKKPVLPALQVEDLLKNLSLVAAIENAYHSEKDKEDKTLVVSHFLS